MKRGQIIGVAALVVAIGLISIWLSTTSDDGADLGRGPSADDTAQAAAPSAAAAGAGAATAALPAGGEARVYAIDPAQSEVYWRIYRSGALARLGHNHVISVADLAGSITLSSDLATTEWELSFPVNALVVDDPELRARYGEEFASTPSDEDKAGTKTNMLTDRVLNGMVYPRIRLEGHGVLGSLSEAQLPLSIEMLGRTIEQTFPATIAITADTVTVSGEYRLTHADLGLTPFTALGGAMAVGENIDFSYRLHAVAVDR
jgi:hypothetical protein